MSTVRNNQQLSSPLLAALTIARAVNIRVFLLVPGVRDQYDDGFAESVDDGVFAVERYALDDFGESGAEFGEGDASEVAGCHGVARFGFGVGCASCIRLPTVASHRMTR